MKKILLVLLAFLFSTNVYSAQKYYKYLKYKNNSYQNIYDKKRKSNGIFPQNSYYVGVGYGVGIGNSTQYSEDIQNPAIPDLQKIDFQGIVFFGFNINPFVTLELEYALKNDTTSKGFYVEMNHRDVNIKNNYRKNNAYFVNFVLKYPYLYQHIPFVKLGIGYSNFKNSQVRSVQGTWEPNNINYDYKTKGIHYKVGTGYEYIINNNHSVQLEYVYILALKSKVKETYIHPSFPDLNVSTDMMADVSYSKINVAYKFSF